MNKILLQKPIRSFTKKKFWTTTMAMLLFFMVLGTLKVQGQDQTFDCTAYGNKLVPTFSATTNWFTVATGGTAITGSTELSTGIYYRETTTPVIVTTLGSGFQRPSSIAFQIDGKIIVADWLGDAILRMNADGTGVVTLATGILRPESIAVQADGKIVIAERAGNIKRMNADGTNIVTIATGFQFPTCISIQSDGKILIAADTGISRINADGTGLTLVGSGFIYPTSIAVQSDGKIVVADGYDIATNAVKRMNADGTGIVTLLAGTTGGLRVQPDGKILIAVNAAGLVATVKRMNADGTGLVTVASGLNGATNVLFDGIGKIIVVEYFNNIIKRITDATATRTAVNVIVNRTPAPTATAQTFCNAAIVSDLVATGTGIQWYASSTGGTPLFSGTALASGNYFASQTTGTGCESISRTSVAVTINVPIAPTAAAQTFCNSATVVNLVATGTGIKWYTTSAGGTALVSTTALSTRSYFASQTINGCESIARASVAVTVNAPAAPTATAQTFCNAATVANLVATGTAIKWYDVPTGGTALASTTALFSGTYYASSTLNGCERLARTAVAVTINAPAAPTATDQTFCNAATVANLVATGTGIKWYSSASPGVVLTSTASLSFGGYLVSQTISGCESVKRTITVFIDAPIAPTATAQTFCNAATVANLVATGTGIKWYTASTGGTALASTTALATGNYFASQTVNGCESVLRTSVGITINSIPTAPTATAQTFCNAAAVANLVATGTGIQWYAASTGGTALVSTTALANGNYFASQTISGCESVLRTSVAVTISAPTAPTAIAQTFCNAATVANLVATGTGIQWYSASTGGTALVSTTALANGNYFASQTISSCESVLRTSVAVTISTPIAPTATAQTFCNAATVANLVATGTGIQWYAASTGGTALVSTTALANGNYFASQTISGCESVLRTSVAVTINAPTAPTATAQTFCNAATVANLVATGTGIQWYAASTSGTALVSTTALANGNYFASQTISGCESVLRTSVAVTINAPIAPTATAQTFCNAATVANLVATGTGIKWYAASTGGTALASTTALANGNYFASQTISGCESVLRTSVAVTINAPIAPTATAQTFCNAATVANLVATGTGIKWYAASTGGTALVSTIALANGNYFASQTISGCESALRTSVAVTINAPIAPTATAQTFCNAATVANLVATGTGIQWYAASTGGSALVSTTALANGNYFASQTISSCESVLRTSVAVTINAPIAPTATAQTFCNAATVTNLVATGTGIKWYATSTGGIALTTTTAVTAGNYFASQTISGCESVLRTSVAVTINAPIAPTATAQTFCNAATVANLVATGTGIQWYSASTGGSALVSTTALANGNYFASQTISGCESARTAVSVTVNATPTAPTATATQTFYSAVATDLVASGSNLKYYNIGGLIASNAILATGNYFISQTVNGCESATITVAVTINSTTWTGSAWSNGLPDATRGAIIAGNYVAPTDLSVLQLEVTGTAIVSIPSGFDCIVTNGVNVAPTATFTFENNANLLQNTNAANTGNITVKRITAMQRLAYTYWSSPVAQQNALAFSPLTVTTRFYNFNEPTSTFEAMASPSTTNLIPAVGYGIRAPNTFADAPSPATTFVGAFTGVPNNGNYSYAATYSGPTKGYHLIGNPYPSTMLASAFFSANPNVTALYFWNNAVLGATGGNNYATRNTVTGIRAASDIGSLKVPTDFIATGQGFYAKINAASTINFTNAMRSPDNALAFFFRNAITDKSLFKLNLLSPTTTFNQIAIGYMNGATNGVDSQIDAVPFAQSNTMVSSLINNVDYVIQGRALPFTNTDVVPLGFKTDVAGNYSFTSEAFEGVFNNNQEIFLKDNLVGTTHNIKQSPYNFTSNIGTFNSRFEIVYVNSILGIDNPNFDSNNVFVFIKENNININSGKTNIKNIEVYDIRGRLVYNKKDINATTFEIQNLSLEQAVLVVRITSEDGQTVSKKIVY